MLLQRTIAIPVILTNNLAISSGDLKRTLYVAPSLAGNVMNAWEVLIGWPLFPLLFSPRRIIQFIRSYETMWSMILFTSDLLYLSCLLFDPIQYLLVFLFPTAMIGFGVIQTNHSPLYHYAGKLCNTFSMILKFNISILISKVVWISTKLKMKS